MGARYRVCLVENDTDTREITRRMLAHQTDFKVVAEFANAESALAYAKSSTDAFNVFLVDWHLGTGRMDGIELIRQLKKCFPSLCCLLITAFDLEHLPATAARGGADGFIFKSDPLKALPERIRAAHAGQLPLSEKAAKYLFATVRAESRAVGKALEPLTPCERQTILRIAEGRTQKEVATERHLSVHTVHNQLTSAYRKLGVHHHAEAIALLRNGASQ